MADNKQPQNNQPPPKQPQPDSGGASTDKLLESMLAGLKQEDENPDAEDERFNRQITALTDEDRI